MIMDILEKVKNTAEKDRTFSKEHGYHNAAVYFHGKIVACNEIKDALRGE